MTKAVTRARRKASVSKASCLKWTDAGHHHQIHYLTAPETIIGRSSEADIPINARGVSRRHGRIVREAGGYILFDLKSTHGTFVNGQRVEQCRLRHGDRIKLGQEGPELVYLLQDHASGGMSETSRFLDLEQSIKGLSALLPQKSDLTDLEKLSCLLDLQMNLGEGFSPEATFQAILKSALSISGAQRGYVLLNQPEGFRFQVGMDQQGTALTESEFHTSGSIVKHVADTQRPVFMTERIGGEFARQESVLAMSLHAVACLPLVESAPETASAELLGILYLDSTQEMRTLSSLDHKILLKLADQGGSVLEKLELIRAREEQKKIQQDLIQAREIQRSLLPPPLPRLGNFQLHQFSHPTRYVGGDFYDFLSLDSGEVVGVLADVSGKGVPAALLSALVQGALQIEFRSSARCDVVLNRVNKLLCAKSLSGKFVTMFVVLLDPCGNGHYISAGHNTAYLYRAASRRIDELPSGGLILGAFESAAYECRTLQLKEGDILVVYSDGLTEAGGPGGEMFGEDRLVQLIRNEAYAGSQALERKLLEAMEEFTRGMAQTDDITFILLEKARDQSTPSERAAASSI